MATLPDRFRLNGFSSESLLPNEIPPLKLPVVADKPFQLNASYQAQVLQPRTAEKASGGDPVGNWTSSGVVSNFGLDVRYFW